MRLTSLNPAPPARAARALLAATGLLLVLAAPVYAGTDSPLSAAQTATSTAPSSGRQQIVTASLEQCVTNGEQAERSATFTGEMQAVPGSARMEMRIEVLERAEGEFEFHPVVAPGLGVWRTSAPGVKVYKYLKQVTNLSGPAVYRGAVRFRWLNARGKFVKAAELRTPKCVQTQAPTQAR